MVNKKDFIEKFINKVKERYSNLNISFEYDDDNDIFDIWHTGKDYELSDEEFSSYTGELIRDILFANNIFNISFGYDYLKTKDISWEFNNDSENNINIDSKIKFGVEREDSIPKVFLNTRNSIISENIIYLGTDVTPIIYFDEKCLQSECFFDDKELDKYKKINDDTYKNAA